MSTLSEQKLTTIRKALLVEQSRLRDKIAQHRARDARDPRENPDRDDLASDYMSRDRSEALLAIEIDLLAHVEEALQRLADGVYGLCTRCGKPINPDRLMALPSAALCIDCQAAGS